MPRAARGAGRGPAPRPRLPGSHCRMRADLSLACSPAPSLTPGGRLGFPLTGVWGLRQPRVEGRGKEVRCGKPGSPALQADSLPSEPAGKPNKP